MFTHECCEMRSKVYIVFIMWRGTFYVVANGIDEFIEICLQFFSTRFPFRITSINMCVLLKKKKIKTAERLEFRITYVRVYRPYRPYRVIHLTGDTINFKVDFGKYKRFFCSQLSINNGKWAMAPPHKDAVHCVRYIV